MIHSPDIWRKALKRLADRIESKKHPRRWTHLRGATLQLEVMLACFIFRLLCQRKLVPAELDTTTVSVTSYRRDPSCPEAVPTVDFHLAHEMQNGRPYNMGALRLIQRILHCDYFAPVLDQTGAVVAVLFHPEPRRPLPGDLSEARSLLYLQQIDVDFLVWLLRQAATGREPGMRSFWVSA